MMTPGTFNAFSIRVSHMPHTPLTWNPISAFFWAKEAEDNAEADKERRGLVEARNQAESLIHSTEKSVEEHGDKVDPTTVEAIELAIAALKDDLESDKTTADKLRAGIQNVTEAAMKLGEAIYKAQAEEGDDEPSMAGSSQSDHDDDIVDADFEDLDNDKRK